jgi:hypothetical protein
MLRPLEIPPIPGPSALAVDYPTRIVILSERSESKDLSVSGTGTPACAVFLIWLFESVGAAANKFEQTHVRQLLKLLSDFVADMPVLRMEFPQGARVRVDLAQREFHFAQRLHT